jgi:hypothetical protein
MASYSSYISHILVLRLMTDFTVLYEAWLWYSGGDIVISFSKSEPVKVSDTR